MENPKEFVPRDTEINSPEKFLKKIESFDYEVLSTIQRLRTTFGTIFWKFFSFFGLPILWPIIGVVFSILDIYHVSYVILFASLSSFVIFPIKNFYQRIRPYDKHSDILPLTKEKDFSFPSGHTYFATVNGISLALCYGGLYSFLLMLGLGAMVAISRVYLGVHYLTDVVVSYLLALIVSVLIYLLFPIILILHQYTLFI